MVASGHPGVIGSGDLMTPDQRAAIAARFAEGNERLRARFFPDRAALFTPKPVPPLPLEVEDLRPLLIATLDQMRGPEVATLARAALA